MKTIVTLAKTDTLIANRWKNLISLITKHKCVKSVGSTANIAGMRLSVINALMVTI